MVTGTRSSRADASPSRAKSKRVGGPGESTPALTCVNLSENGSLRIAVLSDSHSEPHRRTKEILASLRPDLILHAGDIGALDVIEEYSTLCPVLAVRGNIDSPSTGLPETALVEIRDGERLLLRILMLHIGVYGPKLRAEVAQLARVNAATLVICGHSHVPFIGKSGGVAVFNPGSVGPRRGFLPIVFGLIDVTKTQVVLGHVDCETGQTWLPPGIGGE